MKILSLLIGLFASHHWPAAGRWRQYDWLLSVPRFASGRGPDWLPAAALAIAALLAGSIAVAVAESVAGLFGLLLVGTASVLYTLGPHHLDHDIRLASQAEHDERRQVARERLLLRDSSSGTEAAAAALHAALARWFGVVFWFALLGPAGCLLYRGAREAQHRGDVEPDERSAIGHLLAWLNWPVMLLMTAAIALMTDYDRVKAAFHAREDRWTFPAALLDDLARVLCDADRDIAGGLADGRRLAWRALGIWMAVLSLLLLAGLLS